MFPWSGIGRASNSRTLQELLLAIQSTGITIRAAAAASSRLRERSAGRIRGPIGDPSSDTNTRQRA